ncbi:MAG: hypothetical protein JZU53_04720 [Paludibacter sp.]|nr:hypothetical protein [Paludibacter sp.]
MTQTAPVPQNANFDSILNYLVELISEKVAEKLALIKPPETEQRVEKKRVEGVRGIAKYLHISTGTAQRMINEKRIPVYYTGCKLFGYDSEIEEALKN